MGRQNDSAVLHSSIALLQERFRQLQRIKEMRVGRELLKSFSDKEITASMCYDSFPINLPHQILLHKGAHINQYGSQNKHLIFQPTEMGAPASSQSDRAAAKLGQNSTTDDFDDSEVDTSLHL